MVLLPGAMSDSEESKGGVGHVQMLEAHFVEHFYFIFLSVNWRSKDRVATRRWFQYLSLNATQ